MRVGEVWKFKQKELDYVEATLNAVCLADKEEPIKNAQEKVNNNVRFIISTLNENEVGIKIYILSNHEVSDNEHFVSKQGFLNLYEKDYKLSCGE